VTSSSIPTQYQIAQAAKEIISTNSSRTAIHIQVGPTGNVYIGRGSGETTSNGYWIPAGTHFPLSVANGDDCENSIWAICDSGTVTVYVLEEYNPYILK